MCTNNIHSSSLPQSKCDKMGSSVPCLIADPWRSQLFTQEDHETDPWFILCDLAAGPQRNNIKSSSRNKIGNHST